MTGNGYPTEDELHAYVDDALDPVRRAEVAAVLEGDECLRRRVGAYSADRDALREALAGALTRPLPAGWQAGIEAATRRRERVVSRRWTVVAASAAVAATLGTGTLTVLWPGRQGIIEEALAARASGLRAAETIDGAAEASRNARLATALGFRLAAPDLQRFGFQIAKLEVSRRRNAQMTYRDPRQRLLTIYVRPSDGSARFDLLRHGSTRVCVWQDDVVGAVIIAPMSAGEMMRVASAAYAALNL